MSNRNTDTLKGYFETGKRPNQSQFYDLFESRERELPNTVRYELVWDPGTGKLVAVDDSGNLVSPGSVPMVPEGHTMRFTVRVVLVASDQSVNTWEVFGVCQNLGSGALPVGSAWSWEDGLVSPAAVNRASLDWNGLTETDVYFGGDSFEISTHMLYLNVSVDGEIRVYISNGPGVPGNIPSGAVVTGVFEGILVEHGLGASSGSS